MPRIDLLIFPLLGGYLFLISFTITKFYHQRIERQRLIFNSLISAFLVTIIAISLNELIILIPFLQSLKIYLVELNPFNNLAYLNLSIFIFLLSPTLAWILNFIIPKKFSLLYVVLRWGNQMENLFWHSLNYKEDSNKLLMLTTKSNKVYIAYVNRISEPIGDAFVTLIPNFSGYRDKETQELRITTDYFEALEYYIENDATELIDENLGITIPVSEISMVSKFDYNVFIKFNDDNNSETYEQQKI